MRCRVLSPMWLAAKRGVDDHWSISTRGDGPDSAGSSVGSSHGALRQVHGSLWGPAMTFANDELCVTQSGRGQEKSDSGLLERTVQDCLRSDRSRSWVQRDRSPSHRDRTRTSRACSWAALLAIAAGLFAPSPS